MQEISFYLVDAFSDRNFGGNAAAVCPLTEWLPDETLLKMAQQHNQSETAFFVRTDEGYELRWFTTLDEINLCGHATLAASHVIFEYFDHPSSTIVFSTRFVGELRVTRSGDWLTLDFPAWATTVVEQPPAELLAGARAERRGGRSRGARLSGDFSRPPAGGGCASGHAYAPAPRQNDLCQRRG
jgi:predicted PhzF superfamily epimerase YddE/YHI9